MVPLHSLRNPIREAERYLEKSIGNASSLGTVLLLYPGEGFLGQILSRDYPNTKLISIPSARCAAGIHTPGYVWNPTSGESLDGFLHRVLSPEDIATLKILTWPPDREADPSGYGRDHGIVMARLRSLQLNFNTELFFGSRWTINGLVRYVATDSYGFIEHLSGPQIIAASGPSLQKGLDRLNKRIRPDSLIWALPSSWRPLASTNRQFSFAFGSDGGYHATQLHIRMGGNVQNILAADYGLVVEVNTAIYYRQGRPWEKALEAQLKSDDAFYSSAKIDEKGTVAASALSFIRSHNHHGAIIFAGLDLANRAFQSHSEGHHRWLTQVTQLNRTRGLNPLTTILPAVNTNALENGWFENPSLSRFFHYFSAETNDTAMYQTGVEPRTLLPEVPWDDLVSEEAHYHISSRESVVSRYDRFKTVETVLEQQKTHAVSWLRGKASSFAYTAFCPRSGTRAAVARSKGMAPQELLKTWEAPILAEINQVHRRIKRLSQSYGTR